MYIHFSLTLLNVSSFTSNSYIVSINSVRIIRNCRIVTIQMKSVSTNSTFPLQVTQKLKCFSNEVWSVSITKHHCVAWRHTTVLLWLYWNYFGLRNWANQYCVKCKSLNFNFLFIELLLYKISVTLQLCWYSEKHLGHVMLFIYYTGLDW